MGSKIFKNKELWKKNLSNSLKGRKVWNKGKKGVQKAWNKISLPEGRIVDAYLNERRFPNEIAKKFNVSRYTIFRILKRNNIKPIGMGGFTKDKTYEEIYGKEKAKKKKENMIKALRGQPVKNWAHKISESLKNKYEEYRKKGIKIKRKKGPLSQEHRMKLSKSHKEYIKKHPEELERLRKIQPLGETKIETKVLNFLKVYFIENIDFYFDKRDMTGKTLYRPDFQFPKHKIIIELDGYYKHFTKEGYKKDKIREYYLKKAGWMVYRFNFYDIDREYKFKRVKNKILELVEWNKC